MFEEKETKKGRKPDFQSRDGVSVWKHKDKNDKDYLSVSIPLLNIRLNVFSTDYQEEKKAEEIPGEDKTE